MDDKVKQDVQERVKLSKDLANDIFMAEYNSMVEDAANFKKQQTHLQDVIARTQSGLELTEKVQIEARKNPGRIVPIFHFENDEKWKVVNAELAKLQQDIELVGIRGELRTLFQQYDTCNAEVERLEETIKQFKKEKAVRGC
jgi:hypothetical protein